MRLPDLLSLTDDENLQELLGNSSLRLLKTLDPSLATPTSLHKLILDLYTPEGLLVAKNKRALLFDALPVSEINKLATIFGIRGTKDAFSLLDQLKLINFSRGSEKEKALFDYFELTAPEIEVVSETPSTVGILPGYPLFPHQRKAVKEIKEKIYGGMPRVVLHMPTGSGKTRTAMNVIANHFRSFEPTLVIWLAFSEELCEQAADEFEDAWRFIGDREIKVHRFWRNYSISPNKLDDGLLVAGLSKTYSAAKKELRFISELGKRVSLVIIDEAHSAIAETYRLVLETLLVQRSSIALLGLTATPGRTWNDINADEMLATFFYRQKVSLNIEGYVNPVDYLIDEGYLAKAEFVSLFYEGGIKLSSSDIKSLQESLDIPPGIMKRLADDDKRNLKIVLEVEKLAKEHNRIIVFCTTVEHSDLVATILRARGFHAQSVTSKTGNLSRKKFIDEYKENTSGVKILCNYGVLTTGFDAPQTSAALIARPTKSLVLYSQMVGRAIRGKKAGGNETAKIVTVVDQALPGFNSVSDAFQNWEDIWE